MVPSADIKKWVKVILTCDPGIVDQISGECFTQGAEGIEERQKGLIIYFDSEQWDGQKQTWLLKKIQQLDPGISDASILTEPIKWEDWTENWKKNFTAFKIEPNIIVAPDWENPELDPEEVLIKINPSMAFGTGHHETTQLILSLIPNHMVNGMKVLDAGTGSGILAILAAKLGAARITAFDNDAVAIKNSIENAEINTVRDKIDFYTGYLSDLPKTQYDLIVANINRNVLLELSNQWSEYCKPYGKIILSGILENDEENIRKAYEKSGWSYLKSEKKGDWLAIIFNYSPAEIL